MAGWDYLLAFDCSTAGREDGGGTPAASELSADWCIVDCRAAKPRSNITAACCSSKTNDIAERAADLWGGEQHRCRSDRLAHVIDQVTASLEGKLATGETCCLVTVDQKPLRQILHPLAVRQCLELPQICCRFVDLGKEMQRWSRDSNQEFKRGSARQDSGRSMSGRSKGISEIIQELLLNGHKFTSAEVIKKWQDHDCCMPGLIAEDHVPVAKVRGLPWQVSDWDVAEFFCGLNITRGSVIMCLNDKGRRSGEALVRFECEQHLSLALERHRQDLAGRYIEVYKGDASEFHRRMVVPKEVIELAAAFLSNNAQVIVRMRGLPFTATPADIVEFFSPRPGVHNKEAGVLLVTRSDNTATGDAFVLFNDEQDGRMALAKHRQKIGCRYAELFRSTRAELYQVLAMYNVGYHMVNSPMASPPYFDSPSLAALAAVDTGHKQKLHRLNRVSPFLRLCCLRLRGLPFSATTDDIMAFLDAHATNVQGTAHIIYNTQGRPSGEAFAQLGSPEQARSATVDLHLKHMGERYIEVFNCSIQDMSLVLATSHSNQLTAQRLKSLGFSNSNTFNPALTPLFSLPKIVFDYAAVMPAQHPALPVYPVHGAMGASFVRPQGYHIPAPTSPMSPQMSWQPCVQVNPMAYYHDDNRFVFAATDRQQQFDKGGANVDFIVPQAAV